MSYYQDPDGAWRRSAIRNAQAVARQAFRRLAAVYIALALAPSVLAFLAGVVMVYLAARAANELPGWAWWSSTAYLLAVAVVGLFVLRHESPSGRAVSAAHQRSSSVTPGRTELNSRVAWTMRALTAPIAALAVVHLTHLGWPRAHAITVMVIAWLGADLALLVITPARRALAALLHLMTGPTTTGT
jgi:hypothetical protein